jgi:hypothetical protein
VPLQFTASEREQRTPSLDAQGLDIALIWREPLAALGVVGTPTILVADPNGTIRDELVDLLSPERGEALIRDC